jgi:hypothetical protein
MRSCINNPLNYRVHNPPYGYRIQDGWLVLNKSEIRVCSLVVELIVVGILLGLRPIVSLLPMDTKIEIKSQSGITARFEISSIGGKINFKVWRL